MADSSETITAEAPAEEPTYAAGNYAIVEVLGHVRHVGLWQEVERFGQKFCEVRPIADHVVQEPILVGGASIYQFRHCTAAYAYEATESYEYRRARNSAPQITYVNEDEDDDIPFDLVGEA